MRVEMVMKRLAIVSVIVILSAAAMLAQSVPRSTRLSNLLLNDFVRMTNFSTSVVFIGGRPFRRHHFFHHRPFFHRRAFFGRFAHHPFFHGRRFHRGLPPLRSASLGSRMPGRVGSRFAGLRGQLPGGRGMHGSR
jgi:hypothetical protein